MLLISYRTDTTHALIRFLLGVDDSAVCRNINPLQPLLAGIFDVCLIAPLLRAPFLGRDTRSR